jgi:YhcH/YjgK/YiaL family protein
MIFDLIKNINLYRPKGKNFKIAFAFLAQENIAKLPDGKHSISGNRVYVSISGYETKLYENGLWEAHRRYADIHILIEGKEIIAVACDKPRKLVKKYSKKNDCLLLSGEPQKMLKVPLFFSTFLLLLPGEIHMPGLLVSDKRDKNYVKKAVIKVAI